jgi:5-methylcytosine-specific restriction endonuclease McrA
MSEAYAKLMVGRGNPNWKNGISEDVTHIRARQREYMSTPEMKVKVSLNNRNTKARRRLAEGSFSLGDLEGLRLRQRGKCAACADDLKDGDIHVDHIIPIAKGGSNFIGNIQLLCSQCNLHKRTMLPIEYRCHVLMGQKEDDHQMMLISWAAENQKRYKELVFLHHIPNGGYRTKREALKFKKLGVKPGVPDLFLSVPRNGFHGLFIELKVGRNRATPEQMAWIDALNSNGYLACVCVGWEQARDVIVEYLHPPVAPAAPGWV